MSLYTTLRFAGVLGIQNLWLAYRCVRVRLSGPGGVGDLGIPLLRARMRAHANFVEYSPFVLILVGLIELNGGSSVRLQVICVIYIIGRVIHACGIEHPKFTIQLAGALITWLVLLLLSGWGIAMTI